MSAALLPVSSISNGLSRTFSSIWFAWELLQIVKIIRRDLLKVKADSSLRKKGIRKAL
jgi:hypothetical protein